VIAMLFPILLAWLLGFLALSLFWPWRSQERSHLALQLSLALALGTGVTTCSLYLWLAIFGGFAGYVWTEIVAALVLAAIYIVRYGRFRHRPQLNFAPSGSYFSLRRMVAIAFAAALAAACWMFVLYVAREPHGSFDAVGMWNAKARLIFRSGGDLMRAGSAYVSHPDYPLLLPLSIARGWSFTGNESTAFPSALAMVFTFGIVGLLASSIAVMRSRTQGMLAGLVLIGLPIFVGFGAWQYADAPLSFFALSTLVLLCLHENAPAENRSLLVLAGIAAGLAAWTKNEGLLFVVVVMAARACAAIFMAGARPWRRELLWFSAGLVPLLVIVAFYKSRVALPNDILAGQSISATFDRVGDLSRYKLIAKALVQQLKWFGGWDLNPVYLLAVYPMILGIGVTRRNRVAVLTAVSVLGLMFAGYMVTYVVTPRDLPWHLLTSLDRLLVQLWPILVFAYFLTVATPEEAVARGEAAARTIPVSAYPS